MITYKKIILILFCLTSYMLQAQEVSDVHAEQKGNVIEISYYLYQQADISLLLSCDGGASYTIEPNIVALCGDIGKNIQAGWKKIVWNLNQDNITDNIYNARFKIVVQKKSQPLIDHNKLKFSISGISFTMIKVEGGTFIMGATPEQGSEADSNEKPKHKVTLNDYYIGQTEVTQELWEAVIGTTIRQQRNKENRSSSINGEGDEYPMYFVNIYDCQQFVNTLNSLLYAQLNGRKFSLPTEAQWEFAARGGVKSNSYKYSGSNNVDAVAWYSSNANQSSHKVRLKSPNELGIYDMSGNVWEWCQDKYSEYRSAAQKNPQGSTNGNGYVYRGGSWYNGAQSSRVSCRVHDAGTRHKHIGLRLVLQ